MMLLLTLAVAVCQPGLFIGTEGTGHVTPAACVPFGMIQAGPDTGIGDWRYCGGYQYSDRTIIGFSQTHLSGTGCPDLGDVSIMPFCGEYDEALASRIRKGSEKAEPGWYSVELDRFDIAVDISATKRVAAYRLRYPTNACARLLVNLPFALHYPQNKGWARCQWREWSAQWTDDRTLQGRYIRTVWNERKVGFAVRFSRPIARMRELKAPEGMRPSRYLVDFELAPQETLDVRIALSAADETAALRNLEAETRGVDFDAIRRLATDAWRGQLARIEVEDGDSDRVKAFYTALYRVMVQPNDISDADAGKPFYSTFSTWDTFRAAHPLYTILMPELVPGMVDSLLAQGRRTGYLPVWSLWGVENQCMIGTHSVPIIVDWFLKSGGRGPYWEKAYDQIRDTLTNRHPDRYKEDWAVYDRFGYYPFDLISGESVSRTLECSYDDWCAARMAERLGKTEDARFFDARARRWRNVFDPETKMVRGRDSKGAWRVPFDPFALGRGADSGNDFTEGNSWQYTWHVLQDVPGLIEAMGGREAFVGRLSQLFSETLARENKDGPHDVSGLIGQYAHGNEPSHHAIYLFSLAGRQDLAAKYVRQVFETQYGVTPDGLCGNDDCGQMSAWYVFSAMGFYPVNPCGGDYVLGAPQLSKVVIRSGESAFTVIASGLSDKNRYVRSVTFNGRPLTRPILRHDDIVAGGTLVFEMTDDVARSGDSL